MMRVLGSDYYELYAMGEENSKTKCQWKVKADYICNKGLLNS